MITTLLQVALLTMGVGAKASTPVYLEKQPQKQERKTYNQNQEYIDFEMSFTQNNITNQSYWDFEQEALPNDYYGNGIYKAWYNQQDASYTAQMKKFSSAYIWLPRNSYDFETYAVTQNYTNEAQLNDEMYILKLDGSYATSNVAININLKNKLTYDIIDRDYTATIRKDIYVLTTTNSYNAFQTQLNQTDNQNKQWIYLKDFTRYNQYGYSYNVTQYTKYFIGEDEDDSLTHTLTLLPNKTNWIFIFINTVVLGNFIPEYERETDDYIYSMVNVRTLSARYYESTSINELTITGKYIQATLTTEVVDIPGIMWEILTMPFAFISTAFNLTIFPGTPYQLNISNLLMAIFGMLVFIFVIGIVRKKI